VQAFREFISKHLKVNDNEWAELESITELRHYKKGDVIASEGDVWSEYFYIHSGIVRAYMQNAEGKEFTRQFYFNSQESRMSNLFVVDFASLLNQGPSSRSFEVLVDCEVQVIPRDKLNLLYSQSQSWEHFGRIMSELSYLEMDVYYNSLLLQTTKERYKQLLKNMSDLVGKVPQYHIATYLGVTPESLSRLKKDS
jgi:CRP-like cAMP-binding protein